MSESESGGVELAQVATPQKEKVGPSANPSAFVAPVVAVIPAVSVPIKEKWRQYVESVYESNTVVVIMSILTMWALFNNDIRLAATTKEADTGFEVVISVAFFLFILEIGAQSFYKKDYLWFPDWNPFPGESTFDTWVRRAQFGSFYFWLDWISTLSLIFEVSCVFFLSK